MDSFTISFTGRTSTLESVFNPPIDLEGQYQIGLVDFQSYNSIQNVRQPANVMHYYKPKKLQLPKGKTTVRQISEATGGKVNIVFKDGVPHINTTIKLLHHKGLDLTSLKTENIDNNTEDIYYYDEADLITITIPNGSYEINEIVR